MQSCCSVWKVYIIYNYFLYRPSFRFSHWESALRHCSCVHGCQHCLSGTARRSKSPSLTLDRHIEVSRAKSATRDSRKSCVGTELPRLESAAADTLQSLSLQAQRLNITRRLPKSMCPQKRAEWVYIPLSGSVCILLLVSNIGPGNLFE